MRTSKLLSLVAGLTLATTATAGDDFGLWGEAAVEKKINKQFSIDAALGFRAEENAARASRYDASLGATWKVCKYFRMGAGYVYLYSRSPREVKAKYREDDDGRPVAGADGRPVYQGYNVDHAFYRSKHRVFVEAVGKVKAGRFEFSLRERYQFTHYMSAETLRDRYRLGADPTDHTVAGYEETVTDFKPAKDKHYLRSRLQVAYDIANCPVEPFVSYELSNDLTSTFALDKTRLRAGADWKVSKQHKLSLAYVFEDGADDDDGNRLHAIEVGYKFDF